MTADGLLVLDKPAGWTSHDMVSRVRRLCRTRRIGHAGTLDPMATGVLLLGVNKGTKLLTFLSGADKDYRATIRLGQSTTTDDAEGEATGGAPAAGLNSEQIQAAVARLTGWIEQVPSTVSAIKVNGRRAYARVRAGEDVKLAARPVTVAAFDVRQYRAEGDYLDLDVNVTVSAGTYVRALARDLGASLGVGGHLTALRRTRVGVFTEADSHTLTELTVALDSAADQDNTEPGEGNQGGEAAYLIPLGQAAATALPTRTVTDDEARALGFGQQIPSAQPGRAGRSAVAALGRDGALVAIIDESDEQTRSRVVLQPATGG